ncbi:uncharacterized protein LOC101219040 [Cucumis sativus]|uniref:DUF1068 domain-containing protein n=1 Tax=Cucumis sativus TaxID=3659 RepID=A0A0A0LQC2_CUCSA|nr:uncharacterized protein LOC101219040 [Cucumis sativus]
MAVKPVGSCSPGLTKVGLFLMALCIAAYILGPPLYWHFMEGLPAFSSSSLSTCPPCFCDCSSLTDFAFTEELENTTFRDCVKHDSGMNEETEKNFAELLSEELKLREAEALENHRRADISLLEAKKMTSQYQKEADKCNSGMETCEAARERAEATLASQKRLTALWETRARQRGWRDNIVTSRGTIQGS